MASSPRNGDLLESQSVAAEIFIAAAEVWRLAVTKIELRRLQEEEAREAQDDEWSSRPVTPLEPTGGFNSGRRQSIDASRRARRRSSIQAAAGGASLLAVDDATRALLDGLADDASSHGGSRRSSRSASPVPQVDDEGCMHGQSSSSMAHSGSRAGMPPSSSAELGKEKKSFARAATKTMLLKKATGSMLRIAEDDHAEAAQHALDDDDSGKNNKALINFADRRQTKDDGGTSTDGDGQGTRRVRQSAPAGGDGSIPGSKRQFRRTDMPTATEEALVQYTFQQDLQKALCLGPEDVSKALAAAVVDPTDEENQDGAACVSGDASSSRERRSSTRSSVSPHGAGDGALGGRAPYVEAWSHSMQSVALAKAKAVAAKYVTHGQHTQLQKHNSFGSSQHSGPHHHRRRGSRDPSSKGSDVGFVGGGDSSSGGSPLYRKHFTAFEDALPSESPVEGLQPSDSPAAQREASSTPTTGSNPCSSQGVGSFSVTGVGVRGGRPSAGHHAVIVLPGAGSDTTPLPAFHSFAEGDHPGGSLSRVDRHGEDHVLASSVWTAPKSGSAVFDPDNVDEAPASEESGARGEAGGSEGEAAGLPKWAAGRRPSIGSRGSASPPPPLDGGPSSSSSIVFLKSSSNHLIDIDEKVYVRVWTSRREAKKFHRGMAAVAQATHALLLPKCFAVPYSVLLHLHRCTVSVTWLPPLRSEEPLRIRDRSNRVSLLRFATRAIDCALVLGSDAGAPGICDVDETLRRPDERKTLSSLVTTLEGVDGRYYTLFQGLQGGDSSSASSPRSAAASPRSGSRDRTSMSPRSGDDRKLQFDGPVWTAVDRRFFSDRVVMDTARVALSRLPPSSGDADTTAADPEQSELSPRHSGSPRHHSWSRGGSRRGMSPSLPQVGASGRDVSPRLASSTTPSIVHNTDGQSQRSAPISPVELQYACSKGLFDCLSETLKALHRQHHRPIGVPAADVPAAVNAYHSLLMYMSTSQFLRGTFFCPTSATATAAAKRRKEQKAKLRAAVGYTLQYALTLTKEDTASALLLYCIAGELSQLSTIEHGKRIAKKLSNASVMQQNLVEWEADAHAIEHVAMTLMLHMVECRGKLMLDAAEEWREGATLQPTPPSGSAAAALDGTKANYLKRRNSRLVSKSSGCAQRQAYKFSVAQPALVLANLKVAMADMTAVWGTAVADALYRLAFSATLALFQRVAAQIVLPDHQHTSLKQEDLAKAPRHPITGPEGEQDLKRKLQREMHPGMSVARGVLMPLILGVELVHSSALQAPCDIHGLLYHDRAMSTTTGGGKGIREEQLATFHTHKAAEQAAEAVLAREGKPIVEVVVLAGWLLAYSQLLLPERLVAVTKVCRLLRGDDNDTIRLVGKALAITVASAFSIVDLRSSRLMRCIAMARNAMICCGAVDMTLIHFALKPLDAEDVTAMMDVLCDDVRKIATGASSSSRWSSHQLNAFKTLRHIMQSGSRSQRGNSVFSMNERLEGFGDFRLTVHDEDNQLVLDDDNREASMSSADAFPSSTPRSGNLGSGASMFRVGFKFGARSSGVDRNSPTPSGDGADASRGGGPFFVDSMNATPMDEALGSSATVNSSNRWSMSFGRMASSTVYASSASGGDLRGPSSASFGVGDAAVPGPVKIGLPAIRSGSTTNITRLPVPTGPLLTPRQSSVSAASMELVAQGEPQAHSLPRISSTRSTKTVLLLGSDHDSGGRSTTISQHASTLSGNDKPLLLAPGLSAHHSHLSEGVGVARPSHSISRRSSLPRASSPVTHACLSPMEKPEDDDLVDWGMAHTSGTSRSGLTASLALSILSGEDADVTEAFALPGTTSQLGVYRRTLRNPSGWNDDSRSSSFRQQWDALQAIVSSEVHHRSALERDEGQRFVVWGLQQHMELQILMESIPSHSEEEALERRVDALVAEKNQDDRIDVGVRGIRVRGRTASATGDASAAAVEEEGLTAATSVVEIANGADGGSCLVAGGRGSADADDATRQGIVAEDAVDFEARFRDLELDVAVARTEVETYERLGFAPLLQEFTKSLMRSALRSIRR